jgi:hypothetical protein
MILKLLVRINPLTDFAQVHFLFLLLPVIIGAFFPFIVLILLVSIDSLNVRVVGFVVVFDEGRWSLSLLIRLFVVVGIAVIAILLVLGFGVFGLLWFQEGLVLLVFWFVVGSEKLMLLSFLYLQYLQLKAWLGLLLITALLHTVQKRKYRMQVLVLYWKLVQFHL